MKIKTKKKKLWNFSGGVWHVSERLPILLLKVGEV